MKFGPWRVQILIWAKNWPKYFRNRFRRAIERRFYFFSTTNRSRYRGGGCSNTPPPIRAWKSRDVPDKISKRKISKRKISKAKYRKQNIENAKYRIRKISKSQIIESQNIERAKYRKRKISKSQNIEKAEYRIAKYRIRKISTVKISKRKISKDKISIAKYRKQNIEVAKYRRGKISKAKYRSGKISIAKYRSDKISNAKYRSGKISNAKYRSDKISNAKYRCGKISKGQNIENEIAPKLCVASRRARRISKALSEFHLMPCLNIRNQVTCQVTLRSNCKIECIYLRHLPTYRYFVGTTYEGRWTWLIQASHSATCVNWVSWCTIFVSVFTSRGQYTFFAYNFDGIEIETLGRRQNVCLVKTHHMLCNMTYLGHFVTLTWGQVLTLGGTGHFAILDGTLSWGGGG